MTHTTSHDLMRQEPRLSRRKAIVRPAALSLAASAMLPHHAFGQDGLIKLVVGYPPGGASDRAARMVAERMQQILKRVVVVDNRVGAGGRLAAQQLVNTPADHAQSGGGFAQ